MGGAHDKRVDAQAQLEVFGAKMRHEPVPVGFEIVVGHVGKQKARADRPDQFFHALNRYPANVDGLHGDPFCRRNPATGTGAVYTRRRLAARRGAKPLRASPRKISLYICFQVRAANAEWALAAL